MRLKHNKKRNTAFVYEALVRELTKSIIKKDNNKKKKVVSIMKRFYSLGTPLQEELEVYKSIYKTIDLKKETAEKLLAEAKMQHDQLDKNEVFKEQTSLIKNINTMLSSGVFSNFVPNYKTLASIQSIFNRQNSPKSRVLLEEKLVEFLTSPKSGESFNIKDPVDNLVYRSFVAKFNDKYKKSLTEGQKNLLTKYVTSFVDEGMELKIFLNEEIGELKSKIKTLLDSEFVSSDEEIKEKTSLVLEKLESFKNSGIDDILIMDVLRVQSLVSEMENHDN